MKKINKLDISRLNQADFFQFFKAVVKEVNAEPATAALLSVLLLDIEEMDKSFLKGQLTKETKEIERLDTLRDRAFMMFKTTVYSLLFNDNNPIKRDKAPAIYDIIEAHGGSSIARFEYNKESAHISKLVEVISTKEADAVNILGIQEDLDYLRRCNDDFIEYYAKRNTLAVDLVNIIPFSRLRKVVKEHYADFVSDLGSLQRNNPSVVPQVEKIVDRINVEISKYQLLVGSPEASPTSEVGSSNEG
jgi:hypothetical protein